ncbi:hypothetical protein ACFY05_41870 [Microtetraspora fusca]|uniref:Uncharacterized protein n=1 Tax=Microtetraspora fusca TaxID=1997 RepID=A0ABW6VK83_MICFU
MNNPNPIPDLLTPAQRDGLACIRCGDETAPMVPVGHVDGVQVFECTTHSAEDLPAAVPLPSPRPEPVGLAAAPAVHWKDGTTRRTHVRHRADRPPLPLGCRRCGHPPYAHQADSVPSRPHHLYEQPTVAQMRRRGEVRRRLGQCRLPAPTPPRCVRPARPMLPIEAQASDAIRLARHQSGVPTPVGWREPHTTRRTAVAA